MSIRGADHRKPCTAVENVEEMGSVQQLLWLPLYPRCSGWYLQSSYRFLVDLAIGWALAGALGGLGIDIASLKAVCHSGIESL